MSINLCGQSDYKQSNIPGTSWQAGAAAAPEILSGRHPDPANPDRHRAEKKLTHQNICTMYKFYMFMMIIYF